MAWVLIKNGVVVQKQPSPQDGFIEASEPVVCGMIVDGQSYTVPPPTPEQLAELQAAKKYRSDVAMAREYDRLKALIAMTPAEVQAWMEANITNLAQAKDALITLAVAVSILGRRL